MRGIYSAGYLSDVYAAYRRIEKSFFECGTSPQTYGEYLAGKKRRKKKARSGRNGRRK